jgi:hypothetical protein
MKKTAKLMASLSIFFFSLFIISCASGKKIIDSETKVNTFQEETLIIHIRLKECNLQAKYQLAEKVFILNDIV